MACVRGWWVSVR